MKFYKDLFALLLTGPPRAGNSLIPAGNRKQLVSYIMRELHDLHKMHTAQDAKKGEQPKPLPLL